MYCTDWLVPFWYYVRNGNCIAAQHFACLIARPLPCLAFLHCEIIPHAITARIFHTLWLLTINIAVLLHYNFSCSSKNIRQVSAWKISVVGLLDKSALKCNYLYGAMQHWGKNVEVKNTILFFILLHVVS